MNEQQLTPKLAARVEKIAESNQVWLQFPTSRQFHPIISQFVIDESPLKGKVEYMGAYYIERESGFADRYSSYRTGLELDAEQKRQTELQAEFSVLEAKEKQEYEDELARVKEWEDGRLSETKDRRKAREVSTKAKKSREWAKKDMLDAVGPHRKELAALKRSIKKLTAEKENHEEEDLDIIFDVGGGEGDEGAPAPTDKMRAKQDTFLSMESFADTRKPDSGKIGIYFFGELHDAAGDIHWNIAFLNQSSVPIKTADGRVLIEAETICFFDPAATARTAAGHGYDWESRTCIADAFHVSPVLWLGNSRPQQSCVPGSNFTDLFCQSWCLMFLGVFCNEMITSFLHLNFTRYQFQIVKTWVVCTLTRMKDAGLLKGWDQFKGGFFDQFSDCLLIENPTEPLYLPPVGQQDRWIYDEEEHRHTVQLLGPHETFVVEKCRSLSQEPGTCTVAVIKAFLGSAFSDGELPACTRSNDEPCATPDERVCPWSQPIDLD